MLNIYTRPFTAEEQKMIDQGKTSRYKEFEQFLLVFMTITGILVVPLLIVDRFSPVPSSAQLVYCIIILFIAFAFCVWQKKKMEKNVAKQELIHPVQAGKAEVLQIKTTRVIEREDFEDLGPAYYIEVEYDGKKKTLFLWGQYFDLLSQEDFPNTEFELIRRADNKEFLDLKIKGRGLRPEATLPPFDRGKWRKGLCHEDGDILDESIDQLIAGEENNVLRESGS